MITEMAKSRPYVRFEMRAVEDRDESLKAGHYVAKDVEFAIITPIGGHLVVEKEVTPEIKKEYKMEYDAWKEGVEPPVHGIPIKHWPVATPAEIANCIAIKVFSVEDLATLPEPGLRALGMGARALQQKAKAWLESAQDHGKTAQKVSALEVKLEDLERRLSEKDSVIAQKDAAIARLSIEQEPKKQKQLTLPSAA